MSQQPFPSRRGLGSVTLVDDPAVTDRPERTSVRAFAVTSSYWWDVDGHSVPTLVSIGRFFGTYSAASAFRDAYLNSFPGLSVLQVQVHFDERDLEQRLELARYRDVFAFDQARIQ